MYIYIYIYNSSLFMFSYLHVSVLLHTLYTQEGIFPRSFGSHAWFVAPAVSELAENAFVQITL